MRRTALAIALAVVAATASPAGAQWWAGGGWRPCDGYCGPPPWRPGPFWRPAPPWRSGPFHAGPAGPWWNPRALRWRRFAASGRAAERPRRDRAADAGSAAFGGWVWRHRVPADRVVEAREPVRPVVPAAPAVRAAPPSRGAEAVAALPPGGLRASGSRSRAMPPAPVLAAAAMLRRPAPAARPAPIVHAVIRAPEPPRRPEGGPAQRTATIPGRPRGTRPVPRPIEPAALRSEPAAARPAGLEAAPPPLRDPAPPAPATPALSTDVPVAPLD